MAGWGGGVRGRPFSSPRGAAPRLAPRPWNARVEREHGLHAQPRPGGRGDQGGDARKIVRARRALDGAPPHVDRDAVDAGFRQRLQSAPKPGRVGVTECAARVDGVEGEHAVDGDARRARGRGRKVGQRQRGRRPRGARLARRGAGWGGQHGAGPPARGWRGPEARRGLGTSGNRKRSGDGACGPPARARPAANHPRPAAPRSHRSRAACPIGGGVAGAQRWARRRAPRGVGR